MRRLGCWLAGLLIVAGVAAADGGATTEDGRLVVRALGLRSGKGRVAFALFDSARGYAERSQPLRAASLPIRKKRCEWVLEGLPLGEYAVAVFHDVNGNGELDRKMFGIPKEPFGFSNDARGAFGPPGFDEARFTLDGPSTILEIRLR